MTEEQIIEILKKYLQDNLKVSVEYDYEEGAYVTLELDHYTLGSFHCKC